MGAFDEKLCRHLDRTELRKQYRPLAKGILALRRILQQGHRTSHCSSSRTRQASKPLWSPRYILAKQWEQTHHPFSFPTHRQKTPQPEHSLWCTTVRLRVRHLQGSRTTAWRGKPPGVLARRTSILSSTRLLAGGCRAYDLKPSALFSSRAISTCRPCPGE